MAVFQITVLGSDRNFRNIVRGIFSCVERGALVEITSFFPVVFYDFTKSDAERFIAPAEKNV